MIPAPVRSKIPDYEKILWQAQPEYRGYVFNIIVNPLFLLCGFVFLYFLAVFIHNLFWGKPYDHIEEAVIITFLPFIFLTPTFFICRYYIRLITKGYQNTYYILTDKALYLSSGNSKCTVKRHSLHLFNKIKQRAAFLPINPVATGKIILYKSDRHKNERLVKENQKFLMNMIAERAGIETNRPLSSSEKRKREQERARLAAPAPVYIDHIRNYQTVATLLTTAINKAREANEQQKKEKRRQKKTLTEYWPDR